MSIWTHVLASARLDAWRSEETRKNNLKAVKDYFGKQCLWGDSNDVWEDYDLHTEMFLPGGSEGTCQMEVTENPNVDHIDSYTVTIHGSLRDVSNGKRILEWFQNKLDRLKSEVDPHPNVCVRQAIITVEVEGISRDTWTWNDETWHKSHLLDAETEFRSTSIRLNKPDDDDCPF